MLLALWPQGWSRQQRSNATLVAALVVMVLALSLLGQLLSFFPDPIGPNAQAFSEGARTTLWLTLVSGAVGLVLGTAAALARTARWTAVRWRWVHSCCSKKVTSSAHSNGRAAPSTCIRRT